MQLAGSHRKREKQQHRFDGVVARQDNGKMYANRARIKEALNGSMKPPGKSPYQVKWEKEQRIEWMRGFQSCERGDRELESSEGIALGLITGGGCKSHACLLLCLDFEA